MANGDGVSQQQFFEAVDDLKTDLHGAINGMRDRHHDALNQITIRLGSQDLHIANITGKVNDLERKVDDGFTAMRGIVESHAAEPGHPETLEWIDKAESFKDRAMGIILGAAIAGGGVGGGIAALINFLSNHPK